MRNMRRIGWLLVGAALAIMPAMVALAEGGSSASD
jgi:hypothetical protein